MDLAHKSIDYCKDKGIKINYDPDSSTYKTFFGREIPIFFDLDNMAIGGAYYKDTKEINLNPSPKLEKIVQNLLHEIGHANTSTGNFIFTDATMIPAVYLASSWTQKMFNESSDLLSSGLSFLVFTFAFRYLISERLAEGYRLSKNILRNRRLNPCSPQ